MTLDKVRQLAMTLPEVSEEPHFDYTSFRIRRKIFATAPPGEGFLHVFVTPDQREAALAAEPDFLEELHWGKRVVGLRVTLAGAKAAFVGKLLAQAWTQKAPKRLLGLLERR